MTASIWATLIYGLITVLGGIWGYMRANSKASLISGSASGLILILSALLWLTGQTWAFWIAVLTTGLLVVVFSVRLAKTRKMMPAGIMVVLGIATLAIVLA